MLFCGRSPTSLCLSSCVQARLVPGQFPVALPRKGERAILAKSSRGTVAENYCFYGLLLWIENGNAESPVPKGLKVGTPLVCADYATLSIQMPGCRD
jgi:hypothetical protein